MKNFKKVIAFSMAALMVMGMVSCGDDKDTSSTAGGNTTESKADDKKDESKAESKAEGLVTTTKAEDVKPEEVKNESTGEVKEFTAFHAVPGTEISDDNEVQKIIADKIGAKCKDTWLTGQTAAEAMGVMIAGGDYPDFVTAGAALPQMVDAGDAVALDEYWDDYPNVKNFYSEAQWNAIKGEWDHVYLMPQFGKRYMYDTGTIHNDEAFWIQTRVLKDQDYPKLETLDEYFDCIEKFIEKHPTMEDGTPNIGYSILCEDWRYFCLENAPFFLDGYPNDGCCIVDETTHKAIDYNTTPTAKRYFKKLNEEYHKGIIDPETFSMNYDTYISKMSTGRVCGMCDQHWDFNDGELAIKQAALEKPELKGCTYVPQGIVIDKGIKERYHSDAALDVSNGISITKSCKDIPGAMKFLNDLLAPEIHTLRSWGVEGQDYLVGDDGLFYRTQEMRDQAAQEDYRNKHFCPYGYFPQYGGMALDGINACNPDNQPKEFYDSLSDEVKECLKAYNAETYTQLLNKSGENAAWYPMWSYSNNLTSDTPNGLVWANMAEVKHAQLPLVCKADDFEKAWEEYMKVYNETCDVQVFLDSLDAEIQRRIDVAEGK